MNDSRRGVSLAEMLVALSLFAVLALATMSLLLSARSASAAGQDSASVISVAIAKLDSERTLSYATLLNYLTAGPIDTTEVVGGRSYIEHTQVTRLSADAGDPEYNLLDVAVTLSWQSQQSIAQSGTVNQVQRSLVVHATVSPTVNY